MISVDVVDVGFKNKIKIARKTFEDMSDYFKEVGVDWRKTNDIELFKNRSGPGRFEDLDPDYAERKAEDLGSEYPILLGKNKRIRDGLVSKSSPYNVSIVGRHSLTVGIQGVRYAETHHLGLTIKTKWGIIKMPARPFIYNSETGTINFKLQIDRWMKLLEEYKDKKMRGLGDN